MPNSSGAQFYDNGDYLVIDLLDTVRAGQQYIIYWRQRPSQNGSSTLNWSEALVLGSFTVHPNSGIPTTNERYFNDTITANTDTRYIRFFNNDGSDFELDAVSFITYKCFSINCGPGSYSQLFSGYVQQISNTSITNPDNVNGVPNGFGAFFNSGSDRIIVSLTFSIPAGQDYHIIWKPEEDNAQMGLRESADGITWSPC